MIKKYYLFFCIISFSSVFAQPDSLQIALNRSRITDLQAQIQSVRQSFLVQNQSLNQMYSDLDMALKRQDRMVQNTDSSLIAFKGQMESFQALQAQTERSLNLALDNFQTKFEEQNKYAAEMQATLESKLNKEIIIASAIGLSLIVIFILLNRFAFLRGSRQQLANWNEFQDYFLKNQAK